MDNGSKTECGSISRIAEKGIFVKFISALRKEFKSQYPFIQKLDVSLGPFISKSSSFYLGVSPKFGKHVVIHFQHSNKSWEAGEFTINVHISEKLEVTKSQRENAEDFEKFEDGFYRFPSVIGRDKWWCLNPTSQDRSTLIDRWRPSSYESENMVIQEAIRDVCATLEDGLILKAGFS